MNERDRIGLAKRQACVEWPKVAPAIMSIEAIEKPGIETIAMDQHLRLYYDQAYTAGLSFEELVYILKQEIVKPLLGHHYKGDKLIRHMPEWAAKTAMEYLTECSDTVVDFIMERNGQAIPERMRDRPHNPDLTENMALEEMFIQVFPWALLEQEPESNGEGEGEGGEGPGQSHGQGGGSGGGKSRGDGKSQGKGSGKGDGQSKDKSEQGGGGESKGPQDRDRGSNGDGQQRPWEDPPPQRKVGDKESKGIEQPDLDDFSKQIIEGGDGIGSHCGDALRDADRKKDIKMNPAVLLKKAVSRHCERFRIGGSHSTFRRPNRRAIAMGTKCLRPTGQKPIPEICIVIDTSGSMGPDDLAYGLGMVETCLRRLNLTECKVVAADTRIAFEKSIRNLSQVKLAGGGGTSMEVVISEIAQRRKKDRPDLIICVTDGGTYWPDNEGVPVVAAVTQPEGGGWMPDIPEWITTVFLRNQ